jgi:hypothetical protein
MSKTLKLFLAVLALSSLALAQHQKQPSVPSAPISPDATTTCKASFLSGSGLNQTAFCITVNGNIPQFSVAGLEMIQNGQVGEGYGICDTTSNVGYFDYAYTDSGNWLSPTFTQNGNTVTITRKTSDGIWQLKQVITAIGATATGPGSVKVSMALKNLSGVDRNVILLRFADVDADGINSTNDFDFTSQTAWGTNPEGFFSGRGLSITNATFNSAITEGSFTLAGFDGPDPCNPGANGAPQPFHGDGAIVQLRLFNAVHGTTTTVVSTYKPI